MSNFVTRDDGPATERTVANDIVKRALIVAPLALAVAPLFRGFYGVATSLGLALVVGLRAQPPLLKRTSRSPSGSWEAPCCSSTSCASD